jgi:hypothetical protein
MVALTTCFLSSPVPHLTMKAPSRPSHPKMRKTQRKLPLLAGALFINSQEAIPQRQLLAEMGHPQPPTPIQIDNTTALGVVNNNVLKKLKAMDMRFHWLRCRQNQKQFRTYWRAGSTNLGDYVTKHHPAIHHQTIRPLYLTSQTKLATLKRHVTGIITKMIPTARVC